MACLLNVLPEGYGYSIQPVDANLVIEPNENTDRLKKRRDRRMCLDSELNDVRPKGSPPMEFYFENAVRFQTPRRHPLSFMSIGNTQYHCASCGQWNFNGVYFFNPRQDAAIEYYQVDYSPDSRLIQSRFVDVLTHFSPVLFHHVFISPVIVADCRGPRRGDDVELRPLASELGPNYLDAQRYIGRPWPCTVPVRRGTTRLLTE